MYDNASIIRLDIYIQDIQWEHQSDLQPAASKQII